MTTLLAVAFGALAPVVAPSPTMTWLGAGHQGGPASQHPDKTGAETGAAYGDLEPVIPASLVPS